MEFIVVSELNPARRKHNVQLSLLTVAFQEGEEANTTVDSEGKEEVAAEEEPKAPRELTAEELEAKVTFSTSSISQYRMMKT